MPTPRSTHLVILGPTVPLRLSVSEIRVLNLGFILISQYQADTRLNSYDPELAAKLKAVRDQVQRLAEDQQSTYRIHADVLTLAAMIFAVHAIEREARAGRFAIRWPQRDNFPRFLDRLEKFRRRAKRLWFRLGSVPCYREWRDRWQRFVKAARKSLRLCHRLPKRPNTYKLQLAKVMEYTKQILNEAGEKYHEVDLKPIVRAALHHIRQGRGPVMIKSIIWPTADGRRFLLEFVGKRLAALRWKRRAENLIDLGALFPDDEFMQGVCIYPKDV
jgi:hypothetical protein